tara:strand:- start:5 stop:127 length:123 start_codon:yes stop_codon:yes gene_type:complete
LVRGKASILEIIISSVFTGAAAIKERLSHEASGVVVLIPT